MTDFKDVPKSPNAIDVILAYSVSIPSKSIQNYTITIQYRNDEDEDQSIDSLNNAVVTGNIFIAEGTIKPALAEAILRDNLTLEERTDFSIIFNEDTTGIIYQTNQTEDDSVVYYYSGNTTNNWVKFGKYQNDIVKYWGYYSTTSSWITEYNTMDECTSATSFNINCTEQKYASAGDDMYWRIIRTNEDGSLRLLYSGISPDTTEGYIGASAFNSSYNDPMYAGYMYGTGGSLESNRTNINDSTIKTYIDNWYENNLLNNYDKYISKTAIYCDERSVTKDDYFKYVYTGFGYDASTRFVNYKPAYKCGGDGDGGLFEATQAVADKFSASTEGGGNGQLTYPIALMTADESVFAGGKYETMRQLLSSPYPWYVTNSEGNLISNTAWWYLTPCGWNRTNALVYNVNDNNITDRNDYYYIVNSSVLANNAVRPSLSLSSCVEIKSGNGFPESPYEIDYESSCK